MNGSIRFYKGGEWSATTELKQLFENYLGTKHYDTAFELLRHLRRVAAGLRKEPWRWFEGKSGRYPIFIEGSDLFVVYTAFSVDGVGDVVWALHFGERNAKRSSEFYPEEWAVIEPRLKLSGW